MTEHAEADLERTARDVAERVAGREAIIAVAMEPFVDDLGRETRRFDFLLAPSVRAETMGNVRSRLLLGLHDAMVALGEEVPPMIRLLSRGDWERRAGA